MRRLFVHVTLVLSGVVVLASPHPAAAQNCDDPRSLVDAISCIEVNIVGLDPGLAQQVSAQGLLQTIIVRILGLAAILALGVLILGGVMYIISLGEEDRTRKAKRIILFAIVGLLVIGASFVIIQTVQSLLVEQNTK